MAFIFIRHLPTEYNQQGLLQGRRDEKIMTPDRSIQSTIQSNLLELENWKPISRVLCSPLIRTHQTAEAYGFYPDVEPLLIELDFGLYEGKPRDNLLDEIGHEWLNSPSELTLGEPMLDLLKRIQQFMHKYADEKNLLVFGHGAWIRAARAYHQGNVDHMNQHAIANNAITIIPNQ